MGVFIFSLLLVSNALALGMGNADGVWEYIEDITETSSTDNLNGGGADCSRWASGNGDGASIISNWNTAIQSATSTTDENQVRYGRSGTTTCATFANQSGFGFDGNNAIGASLVPATPFWLGRFTHYNNPIYVSNYLEWVDLDVTVSNVVCGNGAPPNEGSTISFVYRFYLEETPNNQYPCPYGGDANGCWDRVSIRASPAPLTLTCDDADEPVQSRGVYTIAVLGLQSHNSPDCGTQSYNSGAIKTELITLEQTDNHACLWAQITNFTPTAVKLSYFTATAQSDVVTLTWETATEIDNLGFNLYRANQIAEERTMLNAELIPSLAPGSLLGSIYEYTDADVVAGSTYYYWLEDVDVSGMTSLHGSVEVTVPPPEGLIDSWRLFIPTILRNE